MPTVKTGLDTAKYHHKIKNKDNTYSYQFVKNDNVIFHIKNIDGKWCADLEPDLVSADLVAIAGRAVEDNKL